MRGNPTSAQLAMLERAASAMQQAVFHAMEADTDAAEKAWLARVDAHFATLVAIWRPTDLAPMRALLDNLADQIGCKVVLK